MKMGCRFLIEHGPHSIFVVNKDHREVLHKIVVSEAYSDDEFAEAASCLGKQW